MAAATTTEIGLVVVGRPSSRWWQRPIPCRVELDGGSVGFVAHHGELAVMVRPGQHVVSAGIWRARTTGYPFVVDQDTRALFHFDDRIDGDISHFRFPERAGEKTLHNAGQCPAVRLITRRHVSDGLIHRTQDG